MIQKMSRDLKKKTPLENLTTHCNHEKNYTSEGVCNFGTERAAKATNF